jgi:hypothetical protein
MTVGKDSHQGAAYVFTRPSTASNAWRRQPQLTATDGAANDSFGGSVALSGAGRMALVGAEARNSFLGAAYVFSSPPPH